MSPRLASGVECVARSASWCWSSRRRYSGTGRRRVVLRVVAPRGFGAVDDAAVMPGVVAIAVVAVGVQDDVGSAVTEAGELVELAEQPSRIPLERQQEGVVPPLRAKGVLSERRGACRRRRRSIAHRSGTCYRKTCAPSEREKNTQLCLFPSFFSFARDKKTRPVVRSFRERGVRVRRRGSGGGPRVLARAWSRSSA